jgi:hypothetical protein
MNMVRTTISLREDFYKKLRMAAAVSGKTMSEIVNNTFEERGMVNRVDLEEKIRRSREAFAKLAKMGKPVNMQKALAESRRERDARFGA